MLGEDHDLVGPGEIWGSVLFPAIGKLHWKISLEAVQSVKQSTLFGPQMRFRSNYNVVVFFYRGQGVPYVGIGF